MGGMCGSKRGRQGVLANQSGLVKMWQLCARFVRLEIQNNLSRILALGREAGLYLER